MAKIKTVKRKRHVEDTEIWKKKQKAGQIATTKNADLSHKKDSQRSHDDPQDTKITKVAIDFGSSYVTMHCKKPGGKWEPRYFATTASSISLNGSEFVPTMTLIEKIDNNITVEHGLQALRTILNSRRINYHVVQHLKLALVNKPPTVEVKTCLEDQEKLVSGYERSLKDLVHGFLGYLLEQIKADGIEAPEVYVNLTDTWDNHAAQKFVAVLHEHLPTSVIEGIDECHASILGRVGKHQSKEGSCLVVDCGHSTMNVGSCEIEKDSSAIKVKAYSSYAAGAGQINIAAEMVLRRFFSERRKNDFGKYEWRLVQWIDDYVKTDPTNTHFDWPEGFDEFPMKDIIKAAQKANSELDKQRIGYIKTHLARVYEFKKDQHPVHILLTGRGSLSATFLTALNDMITAEFPGTIINSTTKNDIRIQPTAVLAGLMHIADTTDPPHTVPQSFWMRSDLDQKDLMKWPDFKDRMTVVQVFEKGASLDPKSSKALRHPMHPIYYDLEVLEDGPPSLDLSIYGTPVGKADNDVAPQCTHEKFRFTTTDKVALFGSYQEELQLDGIVKRCHVYVFFEFKRTSLILHAIYAADGHRIPELQTKSHTEVIKNGTILPKWEKHNGKLMRVLRMGQVARIEAELPREEEMS